MYQVICGYGNNNSYWYYDFGDNYFIEYWNSSSITEQDGEFIINNSDSGSRTDFFYWADVNVEINDIENEQYVLVIIYFYSSNHNVIHNTNLNISANNIRFFSLKKDAEQILQLYITRNIKMHFELEKLYSYIDKNVLNMSENLINIAEEDIMLNYRIVLICHRTYSYILDDSNHQIFKNEHNLKGKEKREAESFNVNLQKKFSEFEILIENFIEIIIVEKSVNKFVASAIVWEAIQRSTILYYAKRWKDECEINLEKSYDKLYQQCKDEDLKNLCSNYIKNVILCDAIEIEQSKEILMYFLLSKRKTIDGLNLYSCFVDFYDTIYALKKQLESTAIKLQLKTKQIRKKSTYTIDDIDLMTGFEFEEFIALLFKKMGYYSHITKKTGDQGVDVIANRNEIRIGIQAKCYTNTVGNSAIQEAVAGKNHYRCNKIVVITNNFFTSSAIELAKSNDVVLWNRDLLKEKIKELM